MIPAMNTTSQREPSALLAYVPASAQRVLDYGCGDGTRGRLLKERGTAEVVGAESDTKAVERATQVLDRVFSGDLQTLELPFPDGYFDCIVCEDVLAQLRDPKPVLERLARVLSSHGLLVVTAPNLRYYKTVVMLAEGRWTYEDRGILARDHLRFFTTQELVRLLQSGGFEARGCTALSTEDPVNAPLDADRCIRMGRVTIGPLNEDEYKAFLSEEYLILATKARY